MLCDYVLGEEKMTEALLTLNSKLILTKVMFTKYWHYISRQNQPCFRPFPPEILTYVSLELPIDRVMYEFVDDENFT